MIDDKTTIAVCCPGAQFPREWVQEWTNFIFNLISSGLAFMPTFAETPNVYKLRNQLVNQLISTTVPIDYVLWVDSDNPPLAQGFNLLLEEMKSHPEMDILTGWCWTSKFPPTISAVKDGRWLRLDDMRVSKPFEIDRTGLPFTLMKFSVLQTLGVGCFDPVKDADGELLGEDQGFCDRVKLAGMKIWIHPVVMVSHLKLRALA